MRRLDLAKERWANVGDGKTAHLVLASQLLSDQPALCGYRPRDGASWMRTRGPHPRPSRGVCERCRSMWLRPKEENQTGPVGFGKVEEALHGGPAQTPVVD